MTDRYSSLLMAILVASSACLAAESTQSQPSVATITGEIRDPTSREIAFDYELPSVLARAERRVVLDSLDRFAFEVPVERGTLVRGNFAKERWKWTHWLGAFLFGHNPLVFFVEPGDSLHVTVQEGFFGPSYSFSGSNADNNRFLAELFPRFWSPRLDYEDLQVEDFSRQADQWLQDQLEFLAEEREEYALSPGFIDYATAHFNYKWATLMISYPREYRRANGHYNPAVTAKYYSFLQKIPLVEEKAIGVGYYRTFLRRTLDWELDKSRKNSDRHWRPKFSEVFDLSSLGLSAETLARLDTMHEASKRPSLPQMVDLSAVGLSPASQARLDSMYEKSFPRLSQRFDLSVFGLSAADQARLDSLYKKSKSYTFSTSDKIEAASVDTTGGSVTFYLPLAIKQDSLAKEPPKLSEQLDLSGLPEVTRAQLDSMYEHRQPLKLSERIDLSSLGLSEAMQAQLDSITAESRTGRWSNFSPRYDLAKEILKGRVLYWFLAEELIDSFKSGFDALALAQRKWEDFQQTNPYPEYNEAVQAVLHKALKLQPGQPAPDFTLHDLDGQSVSLSQFKGQAILFDFWASWCGPCIGNLPDLRAIKERMADQPVVFLNLSLDTDEGAWREAIDKHEIKGVHVRADGFGSDLAESYQVNALPSYYLVDSQGLIVERLSLPDVRDTDAIVATIEKSL